MNNDLRLIVEVKNFIFTLDEILVYFPKGEKVLKDSIYKTSYEVLKQITYANMLKDKESLQKEIVTNLSMLDFYFEFFKRIERNKKSVFLLGDTQEKIDALKAELAEDYPKLIFAGEYAVETCVGDLEAVINDMNATTPDVIISVLPSPMQEQFLYEHRDKMNANIWYGIGGVPVHKKKHGVLARLKSIIHRGKLVNSMNKYDEKEEEL